MAVAERKCEKRLNNVKMSAAYVQKKRIKKKTRKKEYGIYKTAKCDQRKYVGDISKRKLRANMFPVLKLDSRKTTVLYSLFSTFLFFFRLGFLLRKK